LLFQATGVAGLARGGGWLLASLAGGCLAALILGLGSLPAQKLAALAPFVPLVVGMAEAAASLACAVVGADPGAEKRSRGGACLSVVLAGAGLSGAGGVLAAGVSLALSATNSTALWLAATVASGMMAGILAGLSVPLLGFAVGLQRRLAAGPLARALASVAATGAYVLLARWLVR
jgi:hypothetical protein